MQGELIYVCVWFKIETRRFKFFFLLLFFPGCAVWWIQFHIYTFQNLLLAICLQFCSVLSYVLRTILICLTQKIVNYRNKQGTTTNNDDDDVDGEKKSAKNECINIRMCDFITQPVIDCVSFLTFNTLLYTRRG